MKTTRLTPKIRKQQILDAALFLATRNGYTRITREAIAKEARCSPALLNLHFGTMTKLRRAIMRAAIERQNLEIIAQGLVAKDPQAKKAPAILIEKAVASLTN